MLSTLFVSYSSRLAILSFLPRPHLLNNNSRVLIYNKKKRIKREMIVELRRNVPVESCYPIIYPQLTVKNDH